MHLEGMASPSLEGSKFLVTNPTNMIRLHVLVFFKATCLGKTMSQSGLEKDVQELAVEDSDICIDRIHHDAVRGDSLKQSLPTKGWSAVSRHAMPKDLGQGVAM